MDVLKLFLTTEVKAISNSEAENFANECLRPVQYLFNGRKIDYIQQGQQVAVQADKIYKDSEKNQQKTIIMILLLVPAVIIGGAFKIYAVYQDNKDYELIAACLSMEATLIYTHIRDRNFGKKIKAFIAILKSAGIMNMDPQVEKDPLFLSEITTFRLLQKSNLGRGEKVVRGLSSFASLLTDSDLTLDRVAITNQIILQSIQTGLLWNLNFLDTADSENVQNPFGRSIELVQSSSNGFTLSEQKRKEAFELFIRNIDKY